MHARGGGSRRLVVVIEDPRPHILDKLKKPHAHANYYHTTKKIIFTYMHDKCRNSKFNVKLRNINYSTGQNKNSATGF